MSLINKVGFYDVVKENGQVVAISGFVDLMLDYDDKRFYNIPAPMVDGDKDFRDCCGVYFVFNKENSEEHRIGSELIYIDLDGEDFKIGELDKGEINDILYWLLEYCLEDIKAAKMLDEITKEELEEIYYVKTNRIE